MNDVSATRPKALRLWPGVVAVSLLWLAWLIFPAVVPEWSGAGIIAAFLFGAVVAAWWLFFSRAPWLERLAAIALMVAGVYATTFLAHESISNGMMGFMPIVYSIPVLSLALVGWAVATRALSDGTRRALLVVAVLIGCASLMLIRTNGVTGDADSDLAWRWTETPEERLLARDAGEPEGSPLQPVSVGATLQGRPPPGGDHPDRPVPTEPSTEPTPLPAPASAAADVLEKRDPAPVVEEPTASPADPVRANMRVDWPGFRGPERDGIVRGVRIETDWSASPPVELWRRPIGPGWSSFAVAGDRIFTQEQRGDDEIVSAYDLGTGEPVWRHRDLARFWESNGGPGPRGTPTLSNGRVYTMGGTGILNVLDARDGAVVWSRNATSDTGRRVPDWGIASSPVVVGDVVIAATAGSLAAYEADSGKPRWIGPKEGYGYSSPHLSTIDGVSQIVLVNGPGAIGVEPSDGTVLWNHVWGGDSIVQPAVLGSGDLLIGSGSGLAAQTGMLRVTVAREPAGWSVKERWTSNGLKPYFNDFVVHKGHAFGFDGSILACIDLEDGKRKWKGGRYGHGQLVLLEDQDMLLVLSEEGELALVSATADKFTELARFPAIEGKTWNHPVLVGDVLLVRNGEEMAAFRLSLASR
jgi:outer membrane protein assembly factor BamB